MGNVQGINDNILQQHAQVVQDICRRYQIYGNVGYYTPSPIPGSDRNRVYIVAGLDPAIMDSKHFPSFRPDEIIRRTARNEKLFYPQIWAYDLSENVNDVQAQQAIVDYCHTAEFLVRLYDEYGAELPEKLRTSEIYPLIEYRSVLNDPDADPGVKARSRKALDTFFKREKSKSSIQKNWLNYYRSEQFPDNKGVFGRIMGFLNRKDNTMSVKRMLSVNGELHKLEMQEHEYKIFAALMKEKYPEVVFSVGQKDIVDHGLINSANKKNPFGRPVTGEEFAVIRKDRFAAEGFNAIAGLRPSYWEFRDVYYKAIDEPLVAGVYNQITLSYAKCNTLMEMRERGDLQLEKIPVTDFMNFVSLAKANNLRFYIDNDGDFANPSLDVVNVIYNGHQAGLMGDIKLRMITDKVEHSHVLFTKRPSLSSTIQSIEAKKQKAFKTRTPESHQR